MNNLGMFSRMIKKVQAIRRLGSAALDLCWLACGRFDGFWEYYLHPWDTAAAMLIVTEAGGIVTQIKNNEYSIFDNNILAANNIYVHRAMRKILSGKN
jgi:myo-inositol-1(or 4)-monophosphatase